ncbi:MAG TPA: EamA family transporter [Actinophytocola sp.]|uniref:DMT family transporter n=1 Tax=Actinophytocola sp. TaxID=1872138 RepID=UPI002DDD7AA9|nr:EamA family transporter [Actinophytocola sp.]HEV2779325.1 EamA family transporter [Actinophytocola sp.]
MSARAWFLFGLVSIVWGTPYFFIKIAVGEVHPTMIVFVRTLLTVLVLLPLAIRRGALRPVLRRWRAVLALAALEIIAPFLLITYGEKWVSSSLAGLLIATLPLLVALLAMWIDVTERASGMRLVGMLIGLSGVGLVLGFDLTGGPAQLLGAALILLATLCYAGGTFVLKLRLSDVSTVAVIAAASVVAVVVLAPAAMLNLPATVPSPGVWLSLAALGLLCTAVALVAYAALITETGPGRATVITYINPAVAVILGVTLLGEPLTATVAAGFLLIIAGSWLSTGGTLPPRLLALARSPRVPRSRPLPDIGGELVG